MLRDSVSTALLPYDPIQRQVCPLVVVNDMPGRNGWIRRFAHLSLPSDPSVGQSRSSMPYTVTLATYQHLEIAGIMRSEVRLPIAITFTVEGADMQLPFRHC